MGTILSCSLCSGSQDVQSGSWPSSLNLSFVTARSSTATSDEPNTEPAIQG